MGTVKILLIGYQEENASTSPPALFGGKVWGAKNCSALGAAVLILRVA